MTSSQKQEAGEGSTAIQSSGDVTIYGGISIAQMSEIMTAISTQVERLSSNASATIDARLADFRTDVISRFGNDPSTKLEAFSDPDFQASVFDAQRAYARSGDDGLKLVLTDLIAQRSKQPFRNRLTLTLNDAIAKAGVIPKPDLNLMSVMFCMQNLKHSGVGDIYGLSEFLSMFLDRSLHDISMSQFAIQYLTSHGCLTTTPQGINHFDLLGMMSAMYPNAISKGVNEQTFRETFTDFDRLRALGLIVSSSYREGLLKLRSVAPNEISAYLALAEIFGNHGEKFSELAKASQPNRDELISALSPGFPQAQKLFDLYDLEYIRNSRLTSIGIALGHANLPTSAAGLADLSIWVRD